MTHNLSRPVKVASAAALAVGFIAGGALTATATQASPRITAGQCASAAANGEYGYVIRDTANGTVCVIRENGTWIVGPFKTTRCRTARYSGSFKVLALRGDMVAKVKIRFIRGKTVVTKYVDLRPGKRFVVKNKFKKNGTWTVIATHKGERVTLKTVVKPCLR